MQWEVEPVQLISSPALFIFILWDKSIQPLGWSPHLRSLPSHPIHLSCAQRVEFSFLHKTHIQFSIPAQNFTWISHCLDDEVHFLVLTFSHSLDTYVLVYVHICVYVCEICTYVPGIATKELGLSSGVFRLLKLYLCPIILLATYVKHLYFKV